MSALIGFRRAHPVLTRSVLTVFFVCVALLSTYFFSSVTNFYLATGAAFSITILGLSFLTGASGQVSLGNGAFMGVGAYTVAIWANHHPNGRFSVIEELALATLVGAVVGLLVGLPATRLRGPYLAGMTIAFAVAFPYILSAFSSWTGGDAPLTLPSLLSPPGWIVSLFSSSTPNIRPTDMWLADIAIVTAGLAFLLMANLFRSRTGRAMRLVRENEVAAELAGVSLPKARVVAFMVSAAYAGLGGALLTFIQGSAQASQFSLALSISLLSLLVVGGIGTLSGALIGGVIYAYSQTWINWLVSQTNLNPTGNLATNLRGIIFGAALILVMMLAPLGIAGSLRFVVLRRVPRGAQQQR